MLKATGSDCSSPGHGDGNVQPSLFPPDDYANPSQNEEGQDGHEPQPWNPADESHNSHVRHGYNNASLPPVVVRTGSQDSNLSLVRASSSSPSQQQQSKKQSSRDDKHHSQQSQQQPFMIPMFANPNGMNSGDPNNTNNMNGNMVFMSPQNFMNGSNGTSPNGMNGMMPIQMVGMMPGMNGMQGMSFVPMMNPQQQQQKQAKEKKTKKRKRKPKGKPKRPLSAYNLFFKDERERILNSIPGEPEEEKEKKITWPGKKRAPHGKIGFESLAKTIGSRWKVLSKERRAHYKVKADEDLERYANEMKLYEERKALEKPEDKVTKDSSTDEDETKSETQSRSEDLKRPREDSLASEKMDSPSSKKLSKKEKKKLAEKEALPDDATSQQMCGGYFVPMMMVNQNSQGVPAPMNTVNGAGMMAPANFMMHTAGRNYPMAQQPSPQTPQSQHNTQSMNYSSRSHHSPNHHYPEHHTRQIDHDVQRQMHSHHTNTSNYFNDLLDPHNHHDLHENRNRNMNTSYNPTPTSSDHGSQVAAYARSHFMGNAAAHSNVNFLRDNHRTTTGASTTAAGGFGMSSPTPNMEDYKNLISRSFDQGPAHRGGAPPHHHHDYNK